ncbi:MAG: BatD family protein [Rhodothermales bacterium]
MTSRVHRNGWGAGVAGLVLGLCLLAAPAAAQISVFAFVDKTTMGEAETLLFTIEATGDFRDLNRITAPSTRGLTAVQTSPVQSWRPTTLGNQTRQKLTLQWQYRPLGTGTAYLGPATLRIDGRDYTTDPIVVSVVPQSSRPAPPTWVPSPTGSPRPDLAADAPPSDLFIRAEPARASVYLGEQVVIDYVLYFDPNVLPRNSRIASAWDADGFWREELELDRFGGTRTVNVGGRTFEAAAIKRMAVFPTRTGRLQVDSLDVEVDVLRATRLGPPGSPRSFIYNSFGSRFERETITAPPVTVDVEPLPPGAPPSFDGAVGQFGLAVESDRDQVEAGEPVRVTATLSGRGNLATLEAPDWEAPAGLEQYPPRASEQIDRRGEQLRGRKAFTYTLVPRYGGAVTLPPVTWTYFDPEAGAYRTLRSDSLRLRVLGPAAPLAEAGPPAADPNALAVPTDAPTWQRYRAPVPFYARPWVWAGFALPALALLGLVAVRRRRDRDEDSPYARSLRAFPDAERGLRDAAAHLEAGEPRAFYAGLERTLRLFLAARLGTGTAGLALPALAALLAERGVTPETRDDVVRLLRESEAAQFAPLAAHPTAATSERAARLMADVDAQADPLEPEAS